MVPDGGPRALLAVDAGDEVLASGSGEPPSRRILYHPQVAIIL
jgi:hypothetical protein